ncbi:acetate--CoA ligase family protein [Mycolicibacterium baixiangningiae]|uniref:acetate--CoA ligase family protein n=1 Tax=Mycolicibacterium baixiangningiae TaxID=2761578 RepID=UPI001866C466|nr:acetate--CoA ligase family protein [Mycolicibacterium baixiangningiae]
MVHSARPELHPDLKCIFDPASVAVVGASSDTNKWGGQLARGALVGEKRRPVYFVSASRDEVHGRPAVRSLSELPEVPELVALAVPLNAFEGVVGEALDLGVRALIAVNAGFAEAGIDGRRRQDDVVDRLRAAGAVMVGPNCLGVLDRHTDLDLVYDQAGPAGIPAGPVTVISQSGNVGLELVFGLRSRGIGTARFVSVGNQADLDIGHFVEAAITQDETEVIVIYAEEFRRARRLLSAMRKAGAAGKPVVLVTPRGEAAARAAQSHTGAMASNAAVIAAACRDAGVILADTLVEALDCADILVRQPRTIGRRVGVISDGGGHSVLACDALGESNFEIVPFSATLQTKLTEVLDPSSYVANPIDLAAANIRVNAFDDAATAVAASGEVDVLVVTGGLGAFTAIDPALEPAEIESVHTIGQVAQKHTLPLIVHSMFADSAGVVMERVRQSGASVFSDLADGVVALDKVLAARATPTRELAVDVAGGCSHEPVTGYFPARRALAARGVDFVEAEQVRTAEEAVVAARTIGYPVVLKAVDLLHKSDMGGVQLNISSDVELAAAFTSMRAATGSQEYSVESMISPGDSVELIVGARRDPVFGPLIMVGLGGIYAEILRDTALTLAPASADHVADLLRSLNAAALLQGARGKAPADIDAAARAAVAAAELLMSSEEITDVEINPLRVTAEGALALDARVITGA